MKKLSKLFSLLAVGVLAISMTACSSEAKNTVSTAFDNLRGGKTDEFMAALVNSDGSAVEGNGIIDVAGEYIEYDIKSAEKIDDNNYIVNTDISNADLLSTFYNQVAAGVELQETQTGKPLSREDVKATMEQALTAGKALEYKTHNVDVKVTKIDNQWKIVNDGTFACAVLGSSPDEEKSVEYATGDDSQATTQAQ